jgi:hypothetical protein
MSLFQSCRPVVFGVILGCAATGPLAAGHAVAAPSPGARPAVIAGRICREAVRVEPGSTQYAACVESLGKSVARAGIEVRDDELDAMLTRMVAPGGARSYATASFNATQRRYRLACDLAGFHVQGGEQQGCVTALSVALFEADNPQP